MKYLLTLIISILIAYFLLCNKTHINKEITLYDLSYKPYTKPEILKLNEKTFQTEIVQDNNQKSDTKIKVKTKKIINKVINIKDTNNVIKLSDSIFSIRIEQIDSFLFDLKDNNIKVEVTDSSTKIIDLMASKQPKKNYNKIIFISGILTGFLVVFLVK